MKKENNNNKRKHHNAKRHPDPIQVTKYSSLITHFAKHVSN